MRLRRRLAKRTGQGPLVRAHGFTLLELLLSVSILLVVTAIVYASFASVTSSASATREKLEEMRLREFLVHGIEANLAAVYVDADFKKEELQLVGVDDDTLDGPRDTLRFCTTAPVMGGLALPGDVKEVRYEVLDPDSSSMELSWDSLPSELANTEVPLLVAEERPLSEEDLDTLDTSASLLESVDTYDTPYWTVPVWSLDFAYFDGSNWLDEWDSIDQKQLPWAIRVRVNFARTDEQVRQEKSNGLDIVEDPDLELIVPIQIGMGSSASAESDDSSSDDSDSGSSDDDNKDDSSSKSSQGEYKQGESNSRAGD